MATSKSLAEAKQQLLDSKAAFPFNPSAIIDAMQNVEGLEKGLSALKGLQAELFPTEKTV